MTSCTKGNLNKGLLVNIHLASCFLGYTVKFQEAVQSSGVVSSTCLFPKVSSSRAIHEVRHKEVVE